MSLLLTRALADGPLALSDIPQHPAGPQAGVTAGCPDRTGLSALLTAAPPAHPEPGDTAFLQRGEVAIRRGRHPRTVYGRPGIRRRAPPAAAAGPRQTAAGHQDPADRRVHVRRCLSRLSATATGCDGR